jgi:hypothetical protein
LDPKKTAKLFNFRKDVSIESLWALLSSDLFLLDRVVNLLDMEENTLRTSESSSGGSSASRAFSHNEIRRVTAQVLVTVPGCIGGNGMPSACYPSATTCGGFSQVVRLARPSEIKLASCWTASRLRERIEARSEIYWDPRGEMAGADEYV